MKRGNTKTLVSFAITIMAILFFVVICLCNFCLDFASGSHRITPTAIDNDIWGNYKVYYRTSQYTQNNQEDYYYIDRDDKKIAEQINECIRQGKEAIVYYDKYVGIKGISAPKTSPIIKIEVIDK
jgi:hypothetical protein